MKPIIETAAVEGRHIVKNFRLGDTVTEVLRDVSLRVMPGEFVSIGTIRFRKKHASLYFRRSGHPDRRPRAAERNRYLQLRR